MCDRIHRPDTLLRYRDRARDLRGPIADRKLARLIEVLKALLAEGRLPIVFCRFIQTANYLQESLAITSRRSPSSPSPANMTMSSGRSASRNW